MKPEVRRRQKKLSKEMEQSEVNAVFSGSRADIYYYTGYYPSRDEKLFLLFPRNEKPVILATPLENEVEAQYKPTVILEYRHDLINYLKPYELIGFNEKFVRTSTYLQLTKEGIKLVPFAKEIERPRFTKDAYEIQQIKKAIAMTKNVIETIASSLFDGKSEAEVAKEIEIMFLELSTRKSFETIVSSGRRTAFIHPKPSKALIKPEEHVIIDTGCFVNGYASDVTRMFGKFSGKKKRVYEDCLEIKWRLTDEIRAGVRWTDIESLQKSLFERKGYRVLHSFGHSLGISVHDPADEIIEENAVLTVEPGIYIKNFGGFRIEDVVLVKRNGVEILSSGF